MGTWETPGLYATTMVHGDAPDTPFFTRITKLLGDNLASDDHDWNSNRDNCLNCGTSWHDYIIHRSLCTSGCKCPSHLIRGIKYDEFRKLWLCSNCGKRAVGQTVSGGSMQACECGADKTYGPGNNMHSATMPCPLYKKPGIK